MKINELLAETTSDIKVKILPHGNDLKNIEFIQGNNVVGWSTVYKDGRGVHLDSLFLDPSVRGTGLGSLALDTQIKEAMNLNPYAEYISCEVTNQLIFKMLRKRLGRPDYISDDIREYDSVSILPKLPDPTSEEITGRKLFVRWDNPKQ